MVKKKNKIDLFFITDPVYKFKINFLFGGDFDSFTKTIESKTGIKTQQFNGRTLGCFWAAPEKDLYFLWLPRTFLPSTLGHEIIHILFTMFSTVGVPTDSENQETYAYHWEWWFNKIRECVTFAK